MALKTVEGEGNFLWKRGRVVYGTGLENQRSFKDFREFESHRFRHHPAPARHPEKGK